MLLVLFLWLVGEGGQAFFETGVGNSVALVFCFALVGWYFWDSFTHEY